MSKINKKIILREIDRLFNIALKTNDEYLKKSAIKHAIQLSRWTRVKFPRKYSLLLCGRCLSLLSSVDTARVRVRRDRNWQVIIRCIRCGEIKRVPLKS